MEEFQKEPNINDKIKLTFNKKNIKGLNVLEIFENLPNEVSLLKIIEN